MKPEDWLEDPSNRIFLYKKLKIARKPCSDNFWMFFFYCIIIYTFPCFNSDISLNPFQLAIVSCVAGMPPVPLIHLIKIYFQNKSLVCLSTLTLWALNLNYHPSKMRKCNLAGRLIYVLRLKINSDWYVYSIYAYGRNGAILPFLFIFSFIFIFFFFLEEFVLRLHKM